MARGYRVPPGMTVPADTEFNRSMAKPPAPSPKDRQFVTALARGLAILRCFDAQHNTLGASDIARMTGLPQPTVWRLCHTLLQEGYLVQSERHEKLRPGIPILNLGYSAIMTTPIAELAYEAMNTLAKKHQGAVSLGTADGTNILYMQRCQGSEIILRDLAAGSRVPMLLSAAGWGYLAGLDATRRKAALKACKQALPQQYRQVAGRLEQALADFSRQGYIVSRGVLHPQINAVGVPVVSDDGQTVLGLSAGGIDAVFDSKRLKSAAADLLALAQELRLKLSAQHNLL